MKKLAIAGSLLALTAVSCVQERVDAGRLVENYALVTIPAPDLTGITDNGKEVLKLYRMAADEVDKIYWQQYYGKGCMPKSTTVPGTASTESPSCRDTARNPPAPASIRRT